MSEQMKNLEMFVRDDAGRILHYQHNKIVESPLIDTTRDSVDYEILDINPNGSYSAIGTNEDGDKRKYEFDNHNNNIKYNNIDDSGKINTTTIEYDDKNREVSRKYTNADGIVVAKSTIKYIDSRKGFNPWESVSTETHILNNINHTDDIVSVKRFKSGYTVRKTYSTTDTNGNGEKLSKKIFSDVIMHYDNYDNILSTEVLVYNGKVLEERLISKYTTSIYDKSGNAIDTKNRYDALKDNGVIIIVENYSDGKNKYVLKSNDDKDPLLLLYGEYHKQKEQADIYIYKHHPVSDKVVDVYSQLNHTHIDYDDKGENMIFRETNDFYNESKFLYSAQYRMMNVKYPGIIKL